MRWYFENGCYSLALMGAASFVLVFRTKDTVDSRRISYYEKRVDVLPKTKKAPVLQLMLS